MLVDDTVLVLVETKLEIFAEIFGESIGFAGAIVFVVEFNVVSIELFTLFACIKLPFKMFRGNGFGLIISTVKENKQTNEKKNKKKNRKKNI